MVLSQKMGHLTPYPSPHCIRCNAERGPSGQTATHIQF
jgi:hypothetical protein